MLVLGLTKKMQACDMKSCPSHLFEKTFLETTRDCYQSFLKMAMNHQKSFAMTHNVVRVFICQAGIFLKEYLLVFLFYFQLFRILLSI